MTDRRAAQRTRLAIGMAIAATVCLAATLVFIGLAGDRVAGASIRLGEAIPLATTWLAFSFVGAIVVRHRPDNTVGWLCATAGLVGSLVGLSAGIATLALATDPTSPIALASAWLAHVGSLWIVVAPLLILFRFPTGRPLGHWWLRAELGTVGYVGLLVILFAFEPMPLLGLPATPNPLSIGDVPRLSAMAFVPVVGFTALAVSALIVRFRRGSALERRQVRLLGLASVLVGIALATMTLTSPELMSGGRLSTLTAVINAAGLAAIPVAIGIAIVRTHLYDIDRVVNRTLVYAVVSAVLAAVYVVAVLGLSALFGVVAPGARNTLATAGSTLLVAALFRPVRASAQAAMDRRFDRERYEATRIIDSFAGQVRAEVELDAILDDLRMAASRTVRPSATACWIRAPAPR